MKVTEAFKALGTPEGRNDPYPLYEEIRAHGNLAELKKGRLIAVGYEECARAVREPKLEVQDGKSYDLVYPDWRSHSSVCGFTNSMLYNNPPDHSRMRNTVSGTFTPAKVSKLRPLIEDMVDRLLDRFRIVGQTGATAVDVIDEFSSRLPIAVVSKVFGFPETHESWFREVASAVAVSTDGFTDPAALRTADSAMDELNAYFVGLIEERRRWPSGDLVSTMIQIHDQDATKLSYDELLGNLMLLLIAGFETTSFLIGHGLLLALQTPEHARRLRDEPSFGIGYVEEILRFEPPVHVTSRWATTDVQLADQLVPAGTKVIVVLGAGNRDPGRFARPGVFDPDRRDSQPLSFGGGAHFCLGAALARLESQIALPRFLQRFPDLTLAGDPVYRNRWVVRGLEALPVFV